MANERVNFEMDWLKRFNQLCYEVFYLDGKGKELLEHLELKHFRSPVALPGHDSSWAYFNEGKNELIRSFSVGMQSHMNAEPKTAAIKQHKRKI